MVVAVPNRYCVYIVNAVHRPILYSGDFRYTNNDTYEKVPGKENDQVEKVVVKFTEKSKANQRCFARNSYHQALRVGKFI